MELNKIFCFAYNETLLIKNAIQCGPAFSDSLKISHISAKFMFSSSANIYTKYLHSVLQKTCEEPTTWPSDICKRSNESNQKGKTY